MPELPPCAMPCPACLRADPRAHPAQLSLRLGADNLELIHQKPFSLEQAQHIREQLPSMPARTDASAATRSLAPAEATRPQHACSP